MDRTVRLATPADAPAIAGIYNEGIEERIATFETEPRSVAQIEAQLAEKGDRYPTIVVQHGNDVVAWAGMSLATRATSRTSWRRMRVLLSEA
jgi:phosphinothricin acetyltransferase